MHLVQLFLGWLNRLCGKNLKTQFTIERLFVGPRSAYISGKFLFEGVSAEAPGGKAASSFMLDRKMVVGEVRENIYIVMTGAPMTDFGDTYFLRHVERFLTQFQLVDGAAPAAA
jgi:hypothetical protein